MPDDTPSDDTLGIEIDGRACRGRKSQMVIEVAGANAIPIPSLLQPPQADGGGELPHVPGRGRAGAEAAITVAAARSAGWEPEGLGALAEGIGDRLDGIGSVGSMGIGPRRLRQADTERIARTLADAGRSTILLGPQAINHRDAAGGVTRPAPRSGMVSNAGSSARRSARVRDGRSCRRCPGTPPPQTLAPAA